MALIEITNIKTPAGIVSVTDLDRIDFAASSVTDVSQTFSLEDIANSVDLQTAITATELELRVDNVLITDVSKAPFQPAIRKSYTWGATRTGNVTAAALDFRREGRSVTSQTPFVAPVDLTLESLIGTSDNTDDWNVIILTSPTFPATTWSAVYNVNITGGSTTASPALAISAGTYVRVRYNRIANTTEFPGVNLYLTEAL